jgi:hypothetical protein
MIRLISPPPQSLPRTQPKGYSINVTQSEFVTEYELLAGLQQFIHSRRANMLYSLRDVELFPLGLGFGLAYYSQGAWFSKEASVMRDKTHNDSLVSRIPLQTTPSKAGRKWRGKEG